MRLAAAGLTAGVDTSLYGCPANCRTTATINFCNTTAVEVRVRLALTTGGAPITSDYLEYDIPLPPNASLERTGLIMGSGNLLYARASAGGVVAMVYGVEQQV